MPRFPIGMLALLIISILVYFGLAHRVLDRMRLSDKGALGVIAAMVVGSFITLPLGARASINVGGGLVPIGLAVYVLSRAGTTKEWVRALIAAAVTGVVVYFTGRFLSAEPEGIFIDPLYIYPLVGGLVAYLVGRSRRTAFIAATLGVLLLDIGQYIYLLATGLPGRVAIGGAGAFDSIVLAGLVAVLLAEIVGEARERIQGGPAREGRPEKLTDRLKGFRLSPEPGRKPLVEPDAEKNNPNETREKTAGGDRNA